MAFRLFARISQPSRSSPLKGWIAACLVVLFPTALQSKDAPLTAIELYDGPNGPSYVHITGVLINGKAVDSRWVGRCDKNSDWVKSGDSKELL